jgi:hypothetical protein
MSTPHAKTNFKDGATKVAIQTVAAANQRSTRTFVLIRPSLLPLPNHGVLYASEPSFA